MANRVDFNLNVGGKFYRIVYALPKDPYALSGIFLALKEDVSRITNEPNPEIFLGDGHCKTVIASTCDVLTAIGNAKMNKRPSEQLCVNLFVADPQIKKLKDLLAEKEEENSKLAAELDGWKDMYARLYDRERKSISCWKDKVKQLVSKAAILEENVIKVESENQALKLENYELEAFLQRCHITQRKHLADIEQLAMRMDTLENRELNEDINEEAAECEGGWVSEADYAGEKVDQSSDDEVEEDRQEDINRDNQEEEDSENEEMEESERKIAEKMAELAAVPFWNSMASFSMKMESIREKIKKIGEKVDVIEEKEDNLDEHVNRVEERLNKAVKRVEENKEVLLIMKIVPIFKLDFNGATHRFELPLRSEELFRAVKAKVAEIIDDDNPEMFWTDGTTNTLISSSDDIHNALVFGLKGKPWFFLSPQVTLIFTNPLLRKCDRLKEQLVEKEKENSALGQNLYEKYPWQRPSPSATPTPATAFSPTTTPGWQKSSLQRHNPGSQSTRSFASTPTTARPTAQGGTPTPGANEATHLKKQIEGLVAQMKETTATVVKKMEEMRQLEQENQRLKRQNEELERNERVNFNSQLNLLKSINKFETRVEDEMRRMQALLDEKDAQICQYQEESARKDQEITELQDKLKKAMSCIPLPTNRLSDGRPMGVLISETMETSFMYENGCVTAGHPLYKDIWTSFDAQSRQQQEQFAKSVNAEMPEAEDPNSVDNATPVQPNPPATLAQAPPLHDGFKNGQIFRDEEAADDEDEEEELSSHCESEDSHDELISVCDNTPSEVADEEATDEEESELSVLSSLNYHGSDDDDLRPYFSHQKKHHISSDNTLNITREPSKNETCEKTEEDHEDEDLLVADYTLQHLKERISSAQVEARERKIATKIAESKFVPFWARMASFEKKMKGIGGAMKRAEERIEQLEGIDEVKKMNEMEERMDRMEDRVERLQ